MIFVSNNKKPYFKQQRDMLTQLRQILDRLIFEVFSKKGENLELISDTIYYLGI